MKHQKSILLVIFFTLFSQNSFTFCGPSTPSQWAWLKLRERDEIVDKSVNGFGHFDGWVDDEGLSDCTNLSTHFSECLDYLSGKGSEAG